MTVSPASQRRINRLEVIDEAGRAFVREGCKVEFSIQDDGRTCKIFVSAGEPVRRRGASA